MSMRRNRRILCYKNIDEICAQKFYGLNTDENVMTPINGSQ